MYLSTALFAYQLMVHQITKQSPFAMMFDCEANASLFVFPAIIARDVAVGPDKHVQKLAKKSLSCIHWLTMIATTQRPWSLPWRLHLKTLYLSQSEKSSPLLSELSW